MIKIAKCPICGQEPEVWCRDEEIRIRIVCCKHAAYSTPGWNKYVAAMELADAVIKNGHYSSEVVKEIADKMKNVLEVFK